MLLERTRRARAAVPPSSATHPGPPQLKQERAVRVLVVDDVRSNRRFLVQLLRRKYRQWEFSEAQHGLEALNTVLQRLGVPPVQVGSNGAVSAEELAAATAAVRARGARTDSAFELILLDKEMPVMDGYEFVRVLRGMGHRGPVIGVTGPPALPCVLRCAPLTADLQETRWKRIL